MSYLWIFAFVGAVFSIVQFFWALEKYKLYKISKHIDSSTNLNEWNQKSTPEERFIREQLASAAERWINITLALGVVSVISFFVGL